eukprot:CCRYP_019489-RA/>CCRYP_019489-RA protein AED:0.45 eAED:0.45 QI:93/1/1/1/0/0/2/39/32
MYSTRASNQKSPKHLFTYAACSISVHSSHRRR